MNKNSNNKIRIVICGGHHTSSLPLIDTILSQDKYEIVFVGHRKAFSDDKNDSLEFIDITQRKIKF